MTESVRRRKSKWDIKGETNNEIREDNVWSGRAGGSNHGKESQSDWDSSKIADNHGPKWSNMDATTAVQSKDISGWSCVPLPGNFEQKDENVNRYCDEILETTITWGGDQNYSTSMSPGLDGWRKQNHGHSPNSSLSRSRRSRSRSPPHGFKHELEGWNDRTRSESVVSGPPCRDFAVGWCTRGSQCRFYHHDNHDHEGRKQSGSASSESWGSRHGRGASSVHADTEEQRDYSRDRTSHGYGIHHDETQKHETQRNDRPAKKCFEFLKGKCYRGSSCKYAHHSTSADDNVTGERAYDRRDVNEHRREPPHRIKDVLCKYFTTGNCHHGEYCKFSHGSPEGKSRDDKWGHDLDNGLESCGGTKWSHKPPGSLHERLQGMSQDDSLHFSLDSENRSRGGSKWSDKPTAGGIGASTQLLSENNGASTTAPQSIGHGHDQQTSQPWTPNEIISTISHSTTVMAQPTASENAYTLQHPSLRGTAPTAAAFPYGCGNTVTKSVKPPNQTNFFANIPPTMVSGTGEIFNQNGPTIAPQIFTSFTMNGQPQQNNFQPSSISHQQMPCHQEEPIKKPDTTDSKMSQMTSATLMTQHVVTSDQASQITNISASLAQLLENCQQLPQLYAVLNPPSATEVVPSLSNSAAFVTPMAAPFIQPSQAAWSQKQYDPNSNNIELSNLVNPVEPTITASEELGAPSKSFAQSSGNSEPHGGDRFKIGGSEEKFHHESHEFKQLEPVAVSKAEDVSERASDQIKEQQETDHIKDMDVDDQIDEGKRSKDGKGMRMFKFALVEFVKEILKPTWKEGQMSKEAHKTIVKKAVDKVTGTIQGAQIPQTQEKIDQYLSNCKPKLTKLVQAYVEKYLKI